MDLPKEFFTFQSMTTLSGATGATFVVANGLQRALDFNPKWLALAIAEAICIGGAAVVSAKPSDYFVAVVNGFLVYCTAAGATTTFGSPPPHQGVPRAAAAAALPQPDRSRRGFLTRWH